MVTTTDLTAAITKARERQKAARAAGDRPREAQATGQIDYLLDQLTKLQQP